MKQTFNFSFLNLGCTKNLVDTQYLMGNIFLLGANNPNYNVQYIADPYDKKTDYVFLNTCGFIKSGRDEMLATIEKLLKAKTIVPKGKIIYLLGCGLQYFMSSLIREGDPQGGGFAEFKKNPRIHCISRGDRERITITNLITGYDSKTFPGFTFPKQPVQAYTNATYGFEYLKIAEGCDNKCTFCIIPKLRGKLQSRTIPDIVKEAENMIQSGIQEIILIAQDSGRYGYDRYGKSALATLLRRLDKIPGKFSYRVLYLYPELLTKKMLGELRKLKKFIPYFDVPFQHISKNVLKKMGRLASGKVTYPTIIKEIRKNFPKSFIRTNIIIGFPGETEKDFQELKKFIQESDFDNITLFEYHDEPLAASSKLPGKVSDKVIRERFLELDEIVDKQLTAKEKARIGKTFTGYVMGIKSSGLGTRPSTRLVVRPNLHAPEMDPYDTISINHIAKTSNASGIINIGNKISYIL